MESWRVLVVDSDDQKRSETVAALSEASDRTVQTAGSIETALPIIEATDLAVVVTGYNLPDGHGLELAEGIRQSSPGTACILYTTTDTVETESFEETVVEFVPKEAPHAIQTLIALVEQATLEQTQSAYPVPENEAERIQAAEHLVSMEQLIGPFERICRLATEHFDAEVAAVSVIDRNRQEILGRDGTRSIPELRDHSLSTHVLPAEGRTIAVEDTLLDPRFVEIKAIQDAGIQSYLGAKIFDQGENPVGVLSVYDTRSREFTERDRQYLTNLADLAGDILSLIAAGEQR